jgi:hypothetical protein
MGLSSSKSKQTSKPVYSGAITGAAGNISSSYGQQAPKITSITDQLGGIVPDLLAQYRDGDPNVNAAKGYNLDVLNGKYLNSNPYLQDVIDASNADVRNGLAASLGTRGLTGGSDFADIITDNLAKNDNNLRYTDYANQQTRMDQAAAQAPALAAAGLVPISAIESIAKDQALPTQAAVGAGSGIGGLLGQYTNTETTQSGGLGPLLASIIGGVGSGWASSGFS